MSAPSFPGSIFSGLSASIVCGCMLYTTPCYSMLLPCFGLVDDGAQPILLHATSILLLLLQAVPCLSLVANDTQLTNHIVECVLFPLHVFCLAT